MGLSIDDMCSLRDLRGEITIEPIQLDLSK
jgi:hypothetical protein